MPKANPKKTKSARKPKLLLTAGVAMVMVALLFWIFVLYALRSDAPKAGVDADFILQTPGQTFLLEAAKTPAEQEKGLSGRSSLQPNRGMLFVFPAQSQQCFWMKNTLIPLDIIWLDDAKKVTHIAGTVLPNSYPEQFCASGRYVVELNASRAKQAGITVGTQLSF